MIDSRLRVALRDTLWRVRHAWWPVTGRAALATLLLVAGVYGVAPAFGRPRLVTGLALTAIGWVPWLLLAAARTAAADLVVLHDEQRAGRPSRNVQRALAELGCTNVVIPEGVAKALQTRKD